MFVDDNDIIGEKVFYFIGFILTIITLGISFLLFYEFFFQRDEYINKKRLLKYLKYNKPEIKKYGDYAGYAFFIDNYKIIYWYKNQGFSIHNGGFCLSCTSCLSLLMYIIRQKNRKIFHKYLAEYLNEQENRLHGAL